ncbi:MAG: hypothetical protein AB7O67_24045 [Vicinamibacterales bacterium]
MFRAIPVTTTATVHTGVGIQTLRGVELTAGASNAATLVVREVDGSGAIVASVAAVAGTTAALDVPRQFNTALHCTIAGTGAHGTVLV